MIEANEGAGLMKKISFILMIAFSLFALPACYSGTEAGNPPAAVSQTAIQDEVDATHKVLALH